MIADDATIEVGCDVTLAWTLLSDVRLVPEWIAGVADAEIVEVDDLGRPTLVRFVGMPSTASIGYLLEYSYDEASRQLSWETVPGAERRIEGRARVEALAPGRCRFHYRLTSWTAGSLPEWARATLADDTAERVARSFQRFAERRAAAR